jgi:hypothetical protein
MTELIKIGNHYYNGEEIEKQILEPRGIRPVEQTEEPLVEENTEEENVEV